jgi:hypothetical protein
MIDLREPRKGDLLTADFLAAMLRELIRQGKITAGEPIHVASDEASIRITIELPPPLQYAVVTTQAPAFNTSTKVYGKGVATLDVEAYDASDVCTGAATSPAISVNFYNGGKDTVDVGHRIQIYEKVPGRWHAVTEFCV